MFSSPFPKKVGFVSLNIDETATADIFEEKLPREELKVAAAFGSQKRQREFLSGRLAAHQALSQVTSNFGRTAISKGKQGQPIWPKGIVGSITHCDSWAIASVADCSQVKAIGIDLQSFKRPLRYDISKYVCQESEALWAKSIESKYRQRIITIFSAKESIYKAMFPLRGRRLGFKDVLLSWQEELQSFSAAITLDSERDSIIPSSLEVGCCIKDDFVFSYVIL